MSKESIIDFLKKWMEEIQNMNFSKENIQKVIDFGLDTKLMLKEIGTSPGSNFMQSIDLFQNILNEDFFSDDDKYFRDSIGDLVMDISLLISRIEKY